MSDLLTQFLCWHSCLEAWEILETTHEGTKTVKNSKLQMLTTKFEEIRMKEDETFDEFYAKLNDIDINSETRHQRMNLILKKACKRDNLTATLEEYIKLSDDLKLKNLALEAEVKDLKCKLEKSNAQLQQFSSGSKKLDHMLSLGATPKI
ncbi:hypothetical protein CJ030_MR7G016710 [Morella rubra]|uniref:Uncharacterized protein n=1 Tax=Morella rubra TaxID=262757 RepID=A0A6A1UY82_9ROSI|nr:hypothetical protein CJ030_MR7G016710 [Morella rubra]